MSAGHVQVVLQLLAAGAPADKTYSNGMTPLLSTLGGFAYARSPPHTLGLSTLGILRS